MRLRSVYCVERRLLLRVGICDRWRLNISYDSLARSWACLALFAVWLQYQLEDLLNHAVEIFEC
jgi:hypothetical protein